MAEQTSGTDVKGDSVSRTAILVLGMHRSGTSSFARILSLLGADLPNDLMAAGEGNEQGHWESNAIVAFNDRLLDTVGSRWNDWLPLDGGWRKSAVYADFLARAQDLVRAEYGSSPLFVLKDPRICRLAPFWLSVIESLDIRPVITLPQRNPLEVSASLAARDAAQQGGGLLLWLRHVLDAEAATRGWPRQFFTFNQLLDDWQQVVRRFEEATGVIMPRRSVLADGEINNSLVPEARHQQARSSEVQSAAMPPWVRETHAIMRRWCKHGEDSKDFARLDAIRAAFDASAPSFAQFAAKGIEMGEGFASASTLRDEIEEAHAERDRLAEDAARSSTELEEARSERDRQAAEAVRMSAELGEARASLETREREYQASRASLESAIRQRQEEAVQAWSQAGEQRGTAQVLREEVQHTREQNERLIAQFSEIEARIASGALEATQLRYALGETRALLERSEGDLVRARTQTRQLHDECDHLRRKAEGRAEQLRDLMKKLDGSMVPEERARLLARAEAAEAAASRAATRNPEREGEFERAGVDRKDGGKEPGRPIEDSKAEWLREVALVLRDNRSWRRLFPGRSREAFERQLVERSGLFDGDAYLSRNPDVREAGMDPLTHYMRHGIDEGRSWRD